MSQELAKVQEALEEAHKESRRSGKWSNVPEVKYFESDADLTSLRKLVKDGAAKEKIVRGTPTKLFKPTRAGAAAQGFGDEEGDRDKGPGEDDRGKDPGKPRGDGKKPRRPRRSGKKPGRRGQGKKPGRRPEQKKPPRRRHEPKKPTSPPKGPRRGGELQQGVGNTVGSGIGALLVGGMGSSMGGGGITGGVRGGSVGYISGPM